MLDAVWLLSSKPTGTRKPAVRHAGAVVDKVVQTSEEHCGNGPACTALRPECLQAVNEGGNGLFRLVEHRAADADNELSLGDVNAALMFSKRESGWEVPAREGVIEFGPRWPPDVGGHARHRRRRVRS